MEKYEYDREALKRFIYEECVQRGNFKLKSGKESDIFFDMKMAMRRSNVLRLLGNVMIDHLPNSVSMLAGAGYGGSLLLSSMLASPRMNPKSEGVFISTERKDHGIYGSIRGIKKYENLPVRMTLIEDVVTTAQSLEEVVMSIIKAGGSVLNVVALLDREEGAEDFLRNVGVSLVSVFTASEILAVGNNKSE